MYLVFKTKKTKSNNIKKSKIKKRKGTETEFVQNQGFTWSNNKLNFNVNFKLIETLGKLMSYSLAQQWQHSNWCVLGKNYTKFTSEIFKDRQKHVTLWNNLSQQYHWLSALPSLHY